MASKVEYEQGKLKNTRPGNPGGGEGANPGVANRSSSKKRWEGPPSVHKNECAPIPTTKTSMAGGDYERGGVEILQRKGSRQTDVVMNLTRRATRFCFTRSKVWGGRRVEKMGKKRTNKRGHERYKRTLGGQPNRILKTEKHVHNKTHGPG